VFPYKAIFPIVVVNIRMSPFNLKRLKELLLKKTNIKIDMIKQMIAAKAFPPIKELQ